MAKGLVPALVPIRDVSALGYKIVWILWPTPVSEFVSIPKAWIICWVGALNGPLTTPVSCGAAPRRRRACWALENRRATISGAFTW